VARRPRHPNKDIEQVMRQAEEQGWRFIRRTYFVGYCPCGSHLRTIHLTPADPNYGGKLASWFRRQTCWR
jgi:hypothetical protein